RSISERALALERGFENLAGHIDILRKFNLPFIVAVNYFPSDTNTEIKMIEDYCREFGVECAIVEVFNQGGKGALDLASKVLTAAENSKLTDLLPLYPANLGIEEKIEVIAKGIYGAGSIYIESVARKKMKKFSELGFNSLPICIAKTPSSFSDNPKWFGAPKGWTLTITDMRLSAGARFIVVIAGNILLMPGLSKNPRAVKMDVDESGNIVMDSRQIFSYSKTR
ncbi:MAG: formate--tetrahydrofolate ligase, partial [Acidobacteriota bacterium]